MSDAQILFNDMSSFSNFGADWPRELARRLLPKPILCEICANKPAFAFDHDHFLGCDRSRHQCPMCMRGWLCTDCNLILGAWERRKMNQITVDGLIRFVPVDQLKAYLLWSEERRDAILAQSGFSECLPGLLEWSLDTLFGPNTAGKRVDEFWEDAEESLLGRTWVSAEEDPATSV